jgi:DNA excision repair protein ERCC-4
VNTGNADDPNSRRDAAPTNPLRVVADDREAGCGVIEALRERPEISVTVERLVLGDYWVEGDCLFERKTLLDFASSIADGRLFSQALRLIASPGRTALILEGKASDLAQCEMRREALQGAMVSLTLLFKLPILRSIDPAETARLIVYAGGQLRARARDFPTWRRRKAKSKRRAQLQILQAFPGIGPERAELLLQTFGSVEAVVHAPADELQKIPGIGEKTAEAVRWVLQESPRPYGSAAAGREPVFGEI